MYSCQKSLLFVIFGAIIMIGPDSEEDKSDTAEKGFDFMHFLTPLSLFYYQVRLQ